MLIELRYYAFSAVITALIVFFVFDLRHFDPSVPLYYDSYPDEVLSLAFAKMIQETGWLHVNPNLGAPGAMDLYEFPMLDSLDWLFIKAMIMGGLNIVAARTALFFAGFFLSAWTCQLVLRHFGISHAVALCGGLLFAFLPAHFWRGTWHIALSFYPMIPLGVMVCLWICAERPIFVWSVSGAAGKRSLGRALAAIAVCLVISGLAVYYAWFFGFFLAVSGLVAWLRRPRFAPPWDACLCILLLMAGIVAQAVPIVIHARSHERSPASLKRAPGASEYYGLSVPDLILPTLGHRVPKLRIVESRRSIGGGADPKSQSITTRRFINERYWNALGMLGATGFLFLCGSLLCLDAPWFRRLAPADDLAKLSIAAVLLGSDFAVLVEVLVPQIRGYNRVAIYIAFFSIFALALLADRLRPIGNGARRASALFLLALMLITTIGLLDEIPGVMTPDHAAQAELFAAEADYVRKVEALLAPGSSVFELPYGDFPEGVVDYEHLKPYLHSRALRFSFGANRGSKADLWQKEVTERPLPELAEELSRSGFAGLHVALEQYKDRAAFRADLDKALGSPAVEGKNGTWLFYILPRPAKKTP
jgi:phosphoglycerol transferase